MQCACAILSSVDCAVFLHVNAQTAEFPGGGGLFNKKCVFIFLELLSEIFVLILRKIG